jgi:hypothetical protein
MLPNNKKTSNISIKVNFRRNCRTIFSVEKQNILQILGGVCVALFIQRAKRTRRFILSSVTCLALPYFSTLSHKRHEFRKEVIENKMRAFIFSTTAVLNISYSKKNSVRYYHKCTQVFIHIVRYSCQILIKLEFSRQIFEKYSNIKFHENPSSRRRVVLCRRTMRERERETDGLTDGWTDRQTDMMKLIVAFRNFAKAPKINKERQATVVSTVLSLYIT